MPHCFALMRGERKGERKKRSGRRGNYKDWYLVNRQLHKSFTSLSPFLSHSLALWGTVWQLLSDGIIMNVVLKLICICFPLLGRSVNVVSARLSRVPFVLEYMETLCPISNVLTLPKARTAPIEKRACASEPMWVPPLRRDKSSRGPALFYRIDSHVCGKRSSVPHQLFNLPKVLCTQAREVL